MGIRKLFVSLHRASLASEKADTISTNLISFNDEKNCFWSLLAIMMVAMLSLTFASCGSDDDDSGKGGGSSPSVVFVGKWNVVREVKGETTKDYTAPYDYILFTENTFTYYEYSSSKGAWHEDGIGRYHMDGTVFVYDGGDWSAVEVTNYDGRSTLEILVQRNNGTFIRSTLKRAD